MRTYISIITYLLILLEDINKQARFDLRYRNISASLLILLDDTHVHTARPHLHTGRINAYLVILLARLNDP